METGWWRKKRFIPPPAEAGDFSLIKLKDCPYQSEMAAIRIAQTEEVFKKLYLQDMDAASENDKK